MRQVTRKGLITMAAAGGVLALSGGYAHADAGAAGAASNSPGVLSGNSVQAPVHVPVNVCGNSVSVGGLLNPTTGNDCGNASAHHSGEGTGRHRATGSTAEGRTTGSPGIGSGNQVQVPVEIPVNICGNSVTIGGLLNPVFGNDCSNDTEVSPTETPLTPGSHAPPAVHASAPQGPEAQLLPDEQLAHTGAGELSLLIPASAGLLFAGAGTVLYRRSRSAA